MTNVHVCSGFKLLLCLVVYLIVVDWRSETHHNCQERDSFNVHGVLLTMIETMRRKLSLLVDARL